MKKMGAILMSLVLGAVLFVGCGGKEDNSTNNQGNSDSANQTSLSGVVNTGGSTSVERVMNALIYQFQDTNREVSINYEINGSGDGIKNTLSGMYEIGHSSRALKTDGTENGLDAKAYAIDGIAVVMHKNNSVSNLTAEQIQGIYTGEITNWSEVGGEDALITVVTREEGSGTRSAFAEIIGLEKDKDASTAIVKNATTADSTGAVQTTISQNTNAIGYMSFSDVDITKVKASEFGGVAISENALKDGSYKLKREFYMVTKTGATLSTQAQAFVDYVMGAEGQALVKKNKLLPVA